MLQICEQYAAKHNLEFSTDPDPAKSKSKCVHFNKSQDDKPAPVKLCGRPLPWWDKVEHLGHWVNYTGTQEQDCNTARASFIGQSNEILNMFEFASPQQKLAAVQLYCCAWYGSTLWDLYGPAAEKVYRTWSTTCKIAHGVDRKTHTYFVQHYFSGQFPSVRQIIVKRYVQFVQTLASSENKIVWNLSQLAFNTVRSTTGSNVANIRNEFSLCPLMYPKQQFNLAKQELSVNQQENIALLDNLLIIRSNEIDEEIIEELNGLIDQICTN